MAPHQEVVRSPLKNRHRTLAVLGIEMSTEFNTGIPMGVMDYAIANDYNVINFAGGTPNKSNQFGHVRSAIFDLIDPDRYDGVVVQLGSIARYMTTEQVQDFLRPFAGKPIAIINAQWENCIPITIDSAHGMRQLLTHLIEDHGCRKIAFVGGPDHHASSTAKHQAYIDTLAYYGIPYDPAYVGRGDLNRNHAGWCAALFFDERQLEIDAIVSVNDHQAFGIIESLKSRGIRTPQDIIVTGCMDVAECNISLPPLTTIREPMYELGRMAAKAVIDTLEGKTIESDIVLATELVIRQSCGCSVEMMNTYRQRTHRCSMESSPSPASSDRQGILIQVMDAVVNDAMQTRSGAINPDEIAHLAQVFSQIERPEEIGSALRVLEEIIDTHLREDAMTAWQAIIPALQRHMVSVFSNSDPEVLEAMSWHFEAVFANVSRKAVSYRNLISEKYISAFRELSIEMNVTFDLAAIRRIVVSGLGIKECYISLYEDKNNVQGRVKNVLSIRRQNLVDVNAEQMVYPACSLIPQHIQAYEEPYALLVLPMAFRTEPLGFTIVDIFDRKGIVFENLASLFAGALKTEVQILQLKDAEEKFSDIALSTSDWLWEVDEHCRYVYCSDGVERVLGYRADEMLGRSLFDFVLPSETSYLERVKDYLIPCGLELLGLEHINVHKLGHEVTLIISGKPVIKDGKRIGYRGAFKDTTAIKAQENKIRQLAYNDILTGLANRTLFYDRLSMMLVAAERDSHTFAVLFLDLDRFKYVNDTLGHGAGDQLLQVVAQRLSLCVRDVDTLARQGGDEFTILLSRVERNEDIGIIAQRIVNELKAPIEINGQRLFITTSVGVAIYPHDGKTADSLIKNADEAMYRAKAEGKNRFVFYDPQMGEKSSKRLLLEAVLHKSLREEGFQLHYQPQVCAQSCKIVGTEALIRLNTQEFGPVSPMEFITLAEEVGLIDEIGIWVFRTACLQARQWEQKGYEQRVAVNISPRQFRNEHLADLFIKIVCEIGVSAHLIEIEITENAFVDNEEIAKKTLDAFSQHGFKIAIDDFGTGYASLSSLKKYPIDVVKIDRSFINDAILNADSASLVSAMVQIAKSLRLTVIAEGVETQEQLAFLRDLGCDEIQGYLFSKPQAADALEVILRSGYIHLKAEQAE